MAIKVTVLSYALHSGVNEIIVRHGHPKLAQALAQPQFFYMH
jgi:hypothetical protein